MDLSSLSLSDLRALTEKVKAEIKTREVQEIAKAREQILGIAQSLGVPLSDILQGAGQNKTKKGQPAEVKYRHPENASQAWTGRGRQPKWVKEWVESGKSLDKLAVAKA